ncbi:MAG TPA: S41 family peptidase [Gammaproteobacteria bacterium]
MARASVDYVARFAALALAAAVAGCGGGGGDAAGGGAGPPTGGPPASGWTAGSFLPASSFAGRCVNPRTGTNPQTGQPYNETRGTATDENNFLRSWSNDLYLWYNEIVDRDPSLHTTPAYFDLLVTPAKTASGADKDRFHFTYETSDWLALQQSGTEAGYGVVWSVVANLPPRRIVVAYTQPNSPAVTANLQRGEEILRIDGVDVVNSNTQAEVDTFVAGLYPDQPNQSHSFRVRNPTTGAQRDVIMVSANVAIDPVQSERTISTPTGLVGYVHFTDHLPISEQQLIDAFASFAQQGVTDMVLDLRYNGGGLLAIASEVAYMIAGNVPTSGQTFEQLQFNDKHRSINPVTGGPLAPMPFFNASSTGQPLPTLNLSRVFVLTGSMTCSASESIVNGLRGVNVQVIQIGSTTCGKPYGFYPTDNCGTTYFTIQFQGVNAKGFGSYGDGFTAQNTTVPGAERLPGCSVRDDFTRPLGDPVEQRLAAAMQYRQSQTCPAPSGVSPAGSPDFSKPFNQQPARGATDGVVAKSPWLSNRILERP